MELQIKTSQKEELVDITQKVKDLLKESKIKEGILTIFTKHTTAGLTINENADPDVKHDILEGLKIFDEETYRHSEGNSPAHIKSSLLGSSLQIIIKDSELQLGTWQGIMFAEFDGPRTRTVILKIIH